MPNITNKDKICVLREWKKIWTKSLKQPAAVLVLRPTRGLTVESLLCFLQFSARRLLSGALEPLVARARLARLDSAARRVDPGRREPPGPRATPAPPETRDQLVPQALLAPQDLRVKSFSMQDKYLYRPPLRPNSHRTHDTTRTQIGTFFL